MRTNSEAPPGNKQLGAVGGGGSQPSAEGRLFRSDEIGAD